VSAERGDLAQLIATTLDGIFGKRDFGPTVQDHKLADAILAAGYSKPRTITLWGAAFVHNGAFYKEYPTREDAQAFVDGMGEVGAHLVVVTREHTPAVYSEWVSA
jgi:hypothetical protein